MNRIALCAVAVGCVVCLEESAHSQAGQTARGIRLEIQSGSKAEYRVREQLARLNFPNDAVGATESITGALVMRADGTFTGDSRLTVDLRTLRTDEPKRDGFIRENTLETNRYPLAEFVARRYTGLPTPLPTSGGATFTLAGDMMLHGVTTEQTWDVAATFAGDAVTANLIAALAAGATVGEAIEIAMVAASIVIHQLGTTGTATIREIGELLPQA